jgi:hypothetical protein
VSITTIPRDGDGPISHIPVRDPAANARDLTRNLKPGAVRHRRYRTIKSGAHQQVREVDTCRKDTDMDFIGARLLEADFPFNQYLWATVPNNLNCFRAY